MRFWSSYYHQIAVLVLLFFFTILVPQFCQWFLVGWQQRIERMLGYAYAPSNICLWEGLSWKSHGFKEATNASFCLALISCRVFVELDVKPNICWVYCEENTNLAWWKTKLSNRIDKLAVVKFVLTSFLPMQIVWLLTPLTLLSSRRVCKGFYLEGY